MKITPQIQAGFQSGSQTRLDIVVTDPVSGAQIANLVLDHQQILNMLTSLHCSYVGGSFEIYETGLSRVGKIFGVVTVYYVVPATFAFDRKTRQAWLREQREIALQGLGMVEWLANDGEWNYHHHTNDRYADTFSGYFDPSYTVQDIASNIRIPNSQLGNLRLINKDNS